MEAERQPWSDANSTHAAIYNTFYTQSHLIRRQTLRQFRGEAMRAWNEAVAAL